jgi:UDP-glucuronate decarboxylase
MALMAAEANPGGPVNLGNPGEFTINELAALVNERLGTASPIRHEPLPQDDPKRRRPDISRAKAVLGWAPTVPLGEGIEETISYFAQAMQPARQAVPARRRASV